MTGFDRHIPRSFGGRNLSSTGPKTGCPHYLFRFTTVKMVTVNTTTTGGKVLPLALDD